jgi:hypothetical protein
MNILHINYEELIKKVRTVHPHQDAAYFFDFIRKETDCNVAQTIKVIRTLCDLDTEIKETVEEYFGIGCSISEDYAEVMIETVRKLRYVKISIGLNEKLQQINNVNATEQHL